MAKPGAAGAEQDAGDTILERVACTRAISPAEALGGAEVVRKAVRSLSGLTERALKQASHEQQVAEQKVKEPEHEVPGLRIVHPSS